MTYLKLVMEQMGIPAEFIVVIFLIFIWSFVWKMFALWKSARKGSVVWFIVLALVNTVGILEILYIFIFSDMKFENKKSKAKPKSKRRKRRK